MSTIPSVTSPYAASSATSGGSTPTATTGSQTLGQDDFLKLLSQQFQSQDPLKPMDDTAFISQMAQFSSLQETSAMSKTLSTMQSDQQRTAANSYLGHRVTVNNSDGTIATGDVTAIDESGTDPLLVVNGNSYALSSVVRVEPSAVSNSSTTAATTTGQ